MFLPNLSLNARYSIADGGRIIEFPAGDMLNPVYSTLNALTMSNLFPQIENQEFAFLRSREHETKFQLIQPVFNSGIHYNYRIRSELLEGQHVDVDVYRRYLIAEIKKSYFIYLQTLSLYNLGMETRVLLEENLRVSTKLFENQKVTIDVVHRSEAELSNTDQFIAHAEKNKQAAKSYFNFLLNKPFDREIIVSGELESVIYSGELEQAEIQAVTDRRELDMLGHFINASEYNLKLKRSRNHPILLAAVDYGYQGTEYRFTSDDDFVIASFVLKWEFFSGFQNRARIKQAMIEKEILEQKKVEVEKQIQLEVTNAFYDLKAAYLSVEAAEKEVIHAKEAFKLIDRKFREGMSPIIEFIDSRTAMTRAESKWIIAKFDLQVKLAEFERTTAAFDLSILN